MLLENSAQSIAECYVEVNDKFGPTLQGDCGGDTFDFTLLFEQSILSLGPSLLLLLTFPLRTYVLLRRAPVTTPSFFHRLKLGTIVVYGCLQLALLILWAIFDHVRTIASIPSAIFSLVDAFIIGVTSHLEHQRSTSPSVLISVYLLFSAMFDGVQTRTMWLTRIPTPICSVFSAGLAVKIVLVVLEAYGKAGKVLPQYQHLPTEVLVGTYNRSCFWWLNTFLLSGFQKLLTIDDVPRLDPRVSTENVGGHLKNQWMKSNWKQKNSLLYTALRAFMVPFLLPVPARICMIGFTFTQPFLLYATVDFIEKSPQGENAQNYAYGLIGAAALVYIGIAISTGQFSYLNNKAAIMLRGSFISLIYEKTTTIQSDATKESSPLTLMSTDVDRVHKASTQLHEAWAVPVEVGLAIYLLERQVGWPCICPVVLALGATIGNGFVANSMPKRQTTWIAAVQKRIAMTVAVLNDMRSVNVMGLNEQVLDTLQCSRRREIDLQRYFRHLIVFMNSFAYIPIFLSAPLVVVLFVVAASHSMTGPSTVARIFTAVSLIELLTTKLSALLSTFPTIIASTACSQHIQDFLNLEDRHDYRLLDPPQCTSSLSGQSASLNTSNNIDIPENSSSEAILRPKSLAPAVSLKSCSFGFSSSSAPKLQNITLDVQTGQWLVIAGPVGCGKTTLLKALLGEMASYQGITRIQSDQVAFCQQMPWLQNQSIRDNIVGFEKFDLSWYQTVVDACALGPDLESISGSDRALVGSKGAALSGGQKLRIALARALYAKRSTLVLDDIFSGLDAKTEQTILDRCFGQRGLLKRLSTTLIMTSNAGRHLQLADQVILLGNDGHVIAQGSPQALEEQGDLSRKLLPNSSGMAPMEGIAESEEGKDAKSPIESTKTAIELQKNRMYRDLSVYRYYYDSMGWMLFSVFVALLVISAFCSRFQLIWLAWWTEARNERTAMYVGVYFTLAAAALVGTVLLVGWICLLIEPITSNDLHFKLLKAIMSAPLVYFSSVDTGVTVNKFSQDMTIIDGELPSALTATSASFAMALTQIIVIGIGTKYVAIAVPICLAIAYGIQVFYLRTSRQLRLLELEAKSPLYSYFSETSDGLLTIRAFHWQSRLTTHFQELADMSQQPYLQLFYIQCWLTFVLNCLTMGLAVLLVGLGVSMRSSTSAPIFGTAMINLLGFSDSLEGFISSWTTLETSLGAIARVKGTVEDLTPVMLSRPPDNPQSSEKLPMGALKIINASATYRSDYKDPVIKNLSLTITPGERIGICGRTGSGKSSVVAMLCGLLKLTTGSIYLDNVDLTSMSRRDIITQLIALPQEPLLLYGSVRFNLFAGENCPDSKLIRALEAVGLWNLVEEKGGIESEIMEIHLSPGQKQLFRLASATLRKGQFLILDEATSYVDEDTDQHLQEFIRSEFRDHTIIAVAHRIKTMIDFDRVIVLDSGSMVECGKPRALLEEDSIFRELYAAQA